MYMIRSDHAKTMQDKEKHIIEINAEKTKLEEKLETKDRELIWLRSQLGGLEVQCLKIQVAQITVRLEERDKQLVEWKTVADQLIKSNASFDQFKQHMRNMSAGVSAATSPQQSSVCSQDGQEQHDWSVENYKQELKEVYCCYCDCITSKLIVGHYQECNIRERFNEVIGKYGKGWKIRLGDFELNESDKHITLFPHYNKMFAEFKTALCEDDIGALELFDKLQKDLQAAVAQKDSQMNEPVQTDHKNEQMHFDANGNIEEERKGSDIATICHLCGTKVVGPALKWDGIEVIGALMVHFSNDCSYFSNYAIRVNEVAEKWKQCLKEQRLEPYQDIRSFFSACNKFFAEIAPKVERFQKSKGPIENNRCFGAVVEEEGNEIGQLDSVISVLKDDLYLGVSVFQNMMQPLFQYAMVYSTTKADKFENQKDYYLLDPALELSATGRRTYLVRNEAVVWQNPTEGQQQQKLANLTRYWCSACQRIFSCIELWQHHRTADCNVCDVFFDLKYDHSFGSGLKFGSNLGATRSNICFPIRKLGMEEKKLAVAEIKLLNSQYKFEKAKVAKLSAEEKRTPLEQRRVDQEISIKSQFKLSKGDLLAVEDWLLSLSHRFQSNDPFTKVGNPICDAIILPVCPEIFGDDKTHNSKMKAFLLEHSIPVAHVICARKNGCVFVGLEDSRNEFTEDLLRHLKSAMADLVHKVRDIKGNWRNIYIRQIDYTQDLLGFFMSSNVLTDLKIFSEKLDIPYSRALQQLATCFQFTSSTSENDLEVPNTRIKLYNKWVHLLTSGQKKWISMDLKKLFEPSTAFFIDKILPTLLQGFSRLELSTYFYSQEQQQQLFFSMNLFQQNIGNALDVLNSMPQLNYRMSLNQCIESYFQMVDTKQTLVAYEDDLHAVAYSYCQRSCAFAGYLVNTTNKSEQPADFLRRFGRSVNKIFIHAEKFIATKEGWPMQVPISSLNEKHRQIPDAYSLKPKQLSGYLIDVQLQKIKLNCQDPKFYTIFGCDPVYEKQAKKSLFVVDNSYNDNFEEFSQRLQNDLDFNQKVVDHNNIYVPLKKRDKKIRQKEEEEIKGIDVADLIEDQRGASKRWKQFNTAGQQVYGGVCKFTSKDKGATYQCETCDRQLRTIGRQKRSVLMTE